MALAATPALAQKAQPFGQEKVETRQFRNKDVEKALNDRQRGGAHNHAHGKKSHHGHKH